MKAFHMYNNALNKRPILTKQITSFFTMGLGDLISQYLENRNKKIKSYSFRRFFIQASFGVFLAQYFHLQFCKVMPRLFKEGKRFSSLNSMLYDQLLSAPFVNSLFFLYGDLMSGKSLSEATENVKVKIVPTLIANWKIWPLIMTINFTFIPMNYRYLLPDIFGMFWATFLSFKQNEKKI